MHGKKLLTLARELLSLPTAPYHEQCISRYITDYCRGLGVRIESDAAGNLIGRYRNGTTRPPLIFVAHMDHPGFELLNETTAEFLGGVKKEMFVGAKIRFFSENTDEILGKTKSKSSQTVRRQVTAVISSLDQSRWPKRKIVKLRTPVKLPKGTLGMWDLPSFEMKDGNLQATAIDDVAGIIALLTTLTNIVRNQPKTHVWCVFTRAEEVGFHGAFRLAASKRIPKDAAVVSIEMSSERLWAKMGCGPIVRVGDRMTTFDPKLTLYLSKTAQQHTKVNPHFTYQRCLMDGGSCEATAFSAFGYAVGGLCLPLGNYHNIGKRNRPESEYISMNDLKNLVRLTTASACNWTEFSQGMKYLKSRMQDIAQNAPRVLNR